MADLILEHRTNRLSESVSRMHRAIIVLYLVVATLGYSWWGTRVDAPKLVSMLGTLRGALEVEELKPWDEFCDRSAACFGDYYFQWGEGIVEKGRLEEIIEHFEAENENNKRPIQFGIVRPWPVEQLRNLSLSETHWQTVSFWASQDTTIGYLLTLDLLLDYYFLGAFDAAQFDSVSKIFSEYTSFNAFADSAFRTLSRDLDSIKSSLFLSGLSSGIHPFNRISPLKRNLWSRHRQFDDYEVTDLRSIVLQLQQVNQLEKFRRRLRENRTLFARVSSDLEKNATRYTSLEGRVFSESFPAIKYYRLNALLNSELLQYPPLPDTIQVRRIDKALRFDEFPSSPEQDVLAVYYPAFLEVQKRLAIDNIRGVRAEHERLSEAHESREQVVGGIGISLSSRLVVAILPFSILLIFAYVMMLIANVTEGLQVLAGSTSADGPILADSFSKGSALMFLKPHSVSAGAILLPLVPCFVLPLADYSVGKISSFYDYSIALASLALAVWALILLARARRWWQVERAPKSPR